MNLDDRFEIMPDVHGRAFDQEQVILDLASGEYFGLNETGSQFWRCLSEGKSIREAAEELVAVFDVTLPVLLEDLTKLSEDLVRRGLIRKSAR